MRLLNLPSLRINSAASGGLSPFQKVIGRAAAWYDAKTMGTEADQSVLNSSNGAADSAVRGSSAGVDANDPTFRDHDGTHYVRLPGTAGNTVATPRPFATTHYTVTFTDDTTSTGTSAADPVVIGGVAISGDVKKVVLRETTGAGAVGATLEPVVDIDTSADPDAGQATIVSAVSGETWTVNRSASGLKTAVVTRPVWLFDGANDYLQFPASDSPTFTATTGKHTTVVAFRNNVAATQMLWSSEPSGDKGFYLSTSVSGLMFALVGGASATVNNSRSALPTGQIIVVAGVVNEGTVTAYASNSGLNGSSTNISGVGVLTFDTPRMGSRAYAVNLLAQNEIVSVVNLPGEALTETELDDLSATLISGNYTP